MTEPAYGFVTPVLAVEGQVRGELGRDLLRLDVEETTEGLKTLRARVRGVGPGGADAPQRSPYLDGSIVDFGRRLTVSLGPSGGERTVFEGLVSGIEANFREAAECEVLLLAEDALMKLRMTRRMKTYTDKSDAQIAQEIAKAHNIGAKVDADGPTYDVVQQWNQTDLSFLRERARAISAEVWVEGGALCFQDRTKRQATALTLVQGNELIAVKVRADLAHQRCSVSVSGYDAGGRDAIDEQAGEDVLKAEVSGGRTGVSILGKALGTRDTTRVRDVPIAGGEARARGRAELLRRGRAFVTLCGTTHGTPDMVVGSLLTIERIGPPFAGDGYYVTRVRHCFDVTAGHGLRTYFEAERAVVNGGA